jgi:lipopolysaccharide transport system ATP-binding protein
MSDIAIKVEDVSKLYRLGEIGTRSFKKDLLRFWHKSLGKEDPFAKIGVLNDRTKKSDSDWVWALKDINFEVKKGEVLGIIGRNGAGKSTLLKILSKITTPSSGQITINGRIASLLEVGTGFHPELSGRDNIFLNGAILGMRKWEIQKKFDEIVDFSGVEAYIDTPVKRYSSGMYVRLAFAVAAFLEPEILIVDEVLAVGDAEFQKKCLGRMKDVSSHGRTILFVSHNLTAVKTLCNTGLFLSNGLIDFNGTSEDAISKYLDHHRPKEHITSNFFSDVDAPSGDYITLRSYCLKNESGHLINSFNVYEKVRIEIEFSVKEDGFIHYPNIHFFNDQEQHYFVFSVTDSNAVTQKGIYRTHFEIPAFTFNTGLFTAAIAVTSYPGTNVNFFLNPAITFNVQEMDLKLRNNPYTGQYPGQARFQLTHHTVRM